MTKPRHKLSNHDLEAKKADCSICGPRVDIYVGKTYNQCKTPQKNNHTKQYEKRRNGPPKKFHKLSDVDTEQLTATCSVCGPSIDVRLYKSKDKYKYICRTVTIASTNISKTRKHYSNNPEFVPITQEELIANRALLDSQTHCQICDVFLDGTGGKKAQIDHNHKTGKIRGKLCMECNTGLGKFKDDLELLQKAIGYLMLS